MDWKKKWRNLRDAYVKKRKEIRNTKSGQAAQRAQRWQYMEIMSFLDEYTDDSSTETNVPAEGESQSDVAVDVGSDEEDSASITGRSSIVSPTPNPGNDSESFVSSTPNIPGDAKKKNTRPRKRQHVSGDVDSALTELIKCNMKSREELEKIFSIQLVTKDPEDLFFENCAMRMKNMSQQTKSYLQFQISTLFFNAENQNNPPIPITPLSRASVLSQSHTSTINPSVTITPHATPLYHPTSTICQSQPAINMGENSFVVESTENIIAAAMHFAESIN